MALMTLTCPLCNLTDEVEESFLPPTGTPLTCPGCKGEFHLGTRSSPQTEQLSPPASDAPAATTGHEHPQDSTQEPPILPGTELYESPNPLKASAVTPSDTFRTSKFTFTGNAKEYFGIWIVNSLLRVVTLGLYSPWAKVRKRRYFHGNTLLDDAPFDYLADPLAIFKGWFIAGTLFGLYSILSNVSELASGILSALFAAVYPWVVVRARIFALRNTTHRNIHFSFKPNYREAYKVYLWWPLLVPLTLGLLLPHVLYLQQRFAVENSSYGTTPFQFDATPKQYDRLFLPLLIAVPLSLAAIGATAVLIHKGGAVVASRVVPLLGLITLFYVAAAYLRTTITNVTWNGTSLAGHSFASTLRVRDLYWIHLTNAIAVICTLGLLTPWSSVRLARYRLGRLTMQGAGALDAIVAAAENPTSATAEEFGDILGIDLGL